MRFKYRDDELLDGLNVLQIVWIMLRYTYLSTEIGGVSPPTVGKLREKGLVQITPLEDHNPDCARTSIEPSNSTVSLDM